MSGHFEQAYTAMEGDNVAYIQCIQSEGDGEPINVLIPNNYITIRQNGRNNGGGVKEEYLEESYIGENVEVLESVVNIGKKHKLKHEPVVKELVQITNDGKPKGRKRIVADQTRAIRKQRANTNQSYINSKGAEVEPKIFDETFQCNCTKKCNENISRKNRRKIFNMFWSIGTYEGRCAFLNSCINEIKKKRQYTKNVNSRRKMTRKYFLKGIEVCKIMFCKTLQISNSRIDVCLSKSESENFNDERGKKRVGFGFSEEIKQEVISHIKENFHADASLRGMWNTYQATHPDQPVSESYYKRMFYENFNLRVKRIYEKHNKKAPVKSPFKSSKYVDSDIDSD